MLPTTVEKRFGKVEIRADETGKNFIGRAVVYNQPSELIYGMFTEEIAPGAFDESLASGRDVYCSVDHDMCKLLGRQSAGTLKIIPVAEGIDVVCSRCEYSYAQDLTLAIERGDLSGMSFIFDVIEDVWGTKDGKRHRTVKKADLYEVAFVFFPAYPETEAGMRSTPLAIPIDGERRALARMFDTFDKPSLELKRKRIALALCS